MELGTEPLILKVPRTELQNPLLNKSTNNKRQRTSSNSSLHLVITLALLLSVEILRETGGVSESGDESEDVG